MKSDKSRKRFVFLCVAPATILFFIFMILPTLNVFRMSLYERGAYSPNETFVGLKNFQHLLKDTQFIRSMQNMILLVVVVTIITFAFALVFAAILTREKSRGRISSASFLHPEHPVCVVISGIFSAIYKPENGMLNSIIGLFRDMTDPILWKGEKLVIPSIIIAMVWQAVGYYMVMYMASMSSVPASLYESANLDGAGRLTQFFQITIPLVWTNIPYHSDLLYHFYHQYGVPVCQGDDQRRAQRCLGCGPELYVQPERCRSVRLQHGNRCGYLPVLVRLVRLCQSCHQP